MFRTAVPILALIAAAGLPAACTQPAERAAAVVPVPEQPISEQQARAELARARAEFVAAYDAADLDRFVALFAPDATYAGLRQTTWVKGKDEIRRMWGIAFSKDPGRNFEYPEPLTYLSPDRRMAVDAGYAMMMMSPRANASIAAMQKSPMRVSITWVRTDAGWKIVNMTASPRAPVAAGFLTGH